MSRDFKGSRDERNKPKKKRETGPQHENYRPPKRQFSQQKSQTRRRPESYPRNQRKDNSYPRPGSSTRTPPRQTIEGFLRSQNGFCGPLCPERAFKCQKRALGRRYLDDKRTPQIECNFIEGEPCEGPRCQFAFCIKRQLRLNGKCGIFEKKPEKSNTKWDDEEELEEPKSPKKRSNFRLQDKARKKMRKYEDYDNY